MVLNYFDKTWFNSRKKTFISNWKKSSMISSNRLSHWIFQVRIRIRKCARPGIRVEFKSHKSNSFSSRTKLLFGGGMSRFTYEYNNLGQFGSTFSNNAILLTSLLHVKMSGYFIKSFILTCPVYTNIFVFRKKNCQYRDFRAETSPNENSGDFTFYRGIHEILTLLF